MKQETFTDIEYSFRKKKTKREEFLETMGEIIPWDEWVGVIEPYYAQGKCHHRHCPDAAARHLQHAQEE